MPHLVKKLYLCPKAKLTTSPLMKELLQRGEIQGNILEDETSRDIFEEKKSRDILEEKTFRDVNTADSSPRCSFLIQCCQLDQASQSVSFT